MKFPRDPLQILSGIEHCADLITLHYPNWDFFYVSPAAGALIGYEPGELIGRNFFDFIHSDDVTVAMRSRAFIRRGNKYKDKLSICRILNKQGEPVWVESVSRPVLSPATGEIELIVTVTRDISKRSDIDDFLRESLSWRNAILNSANYAIIVSDLDGTITSINTCAERLLGYSAAELVGNEKPDLFLEKSGFRATPGDDSVSEGERTFIRKDGGRVPVHLSHSPIRNESGETKGYLYFARDLSAEKQSQEELSASEAKFRGVVEASPDAFFLLRAIRDEQQREIVDLEIEEVNTKAGRVFARRRKDLIGNRVVARFSWSRDIDLFFRCRDAIATGEAFESEFLGESEIFGGRWFRIQGVPIQDAIAIFLRDVSSKKRAEEIILEQNRAILNASKLSALGEMAAGIAHEVNNPLAIIQTCADQLETYAEAGVLAQADVLRVADKIHTTVSRVGKIIRSLRSFARDGQNDPMERGSLERIVSETLEFCRERFRNNSVALRVSKFGPDCEVSCRPTQISQVVLNLLNNSFDAVQNLEERWVSIELSETRGWYLISVTDSGRGIPLEIQEKLMQPFFTTKELGKGTGLGLSIAKGIIEAHSGRLYLDPERANTTFIIELPKPIPTESKAVAA